jgi:hypothetical protein
MGRQTQSDDATEDGRTVKEIMQSDDCVRSVRNPDGRLAAYRDGDEHVIVSKGDEPQTRWTKRVPAERTDVEVGDRLWTIPDNWECIARESRDAIAYGIFEIDDTGEIIKLSIPTNNHLVDKWYGVRRVGTDLTADAEGALGAADDVRALADDLECDDIDHVDDPEALRRIADHWDAVEAELQMAEDWVADVGIDQQRPTPQPLHLDDWATEFQTRVFKPGEVIDREVDLSDLDTDTSLLLDALRRDGLLPGHYRFRISLED